MAFLAALLQILEYFFQNLQNSNIFVSIISKINPFFHVYHIEFIEKISLSTISEFSQKFPMKYQIFLHINVVLMMYE